MIDFSKCLTPEQKECNRLRKEDEDRRTIGTIKAIDTIDKVFVKTVTLSKDLRVIDFGWPMQYDLDELKDMICKYEDTENFCIDRYGRNHNGFPVSISFGLLKPLLERAKALRETLKSEGYLERKIANPWPLPIILSIASETDLKNFIKALRYAQNHNSFAEIRDAATEALEIIKKETSHALS